MVHKHRSRCSSVETNKQTKDPVEFWKKILTIIKMPNRKVNNTPKLNNAARARMAARRKALNNAKKANSGLMGILRGLAMRGG
jgi:hypothetical protein